MGLVKTEDEETEIKFEVRITSATAKKISQSSADNVGGKAKPEDDDEGRLQPGCSRRVLNFSFKRDNYDA